jgi:hypothetical protein
MYVEVVGVVFPLQSPLPDAFPFQSVSRLGFTNSRSVPRVVWGVRLDWNGFFSSSFIQKWPASLVLVILCTNRICRLILNFIATSCYE